MAIDPGNKNCIRSLILYCADSFPDGWTGKLFRFFREHGMDIRVEAEPVIMHDFQIINRAMNFEKFISGAIQTGQMTQNDADGLMKEIQRADRSGFFSFHT